MSAHQMAETAMIHATAVYHSMFHGDAYRDAELRVVELANLIIARQVQS